MFACRVTFIVYLKRNENFNSFYLLLQIIRIFKYNFAWLFVRAVALYDEDFNGTFKQSVGVFLRGKKFTRRTFLGKLAFHNHKLIDDDDLVLYGKFHVVNG